MTTPNNTVFPVWNKKTITSGTKYIYVPNDFADYDELWAHVLVHGANGSPTSGNVQMIWQISHPQSGGSYHDVSPIWQDLNYKHNSHLLHSGLDFPYKVVRTVPATFTTLPDYVRGVRLGTGRVRIKILINLNGGTDPSYSISLALYGRRSTSDMKPIPQPKYLTTVNVTLDYIRDVWGYSVRNKDTSPAKVLLKNQDTNGTVMLAEHLDSEGSSVKMFDRPIRFESGVFTQVNAGGVNGVDVTLYTTDNIEF